MAEPSLASSEAPPIPAAEPIVEVKPAAEQLYPPKEGDPPIEVKPAEEPKTVEEPKSVAEGEKPELTLDSYEVKLPEGFTADESLISDFKKMALEDKLPPASAQKYVDMYANAAQGMMKQLTDQHAAAQAAWQKEIFAMPEFQGERLTQSKAILGRAMEEYGSPEARTILNESGLGNHPALVKYLLNLAEGLVEGTSVPAGKPTANGKGAPRTAGELFYPEMQNQRT